MHFKLKYSLEFSTSALHTTSTVVDVIDSNDVPLNIKRYIKVTTIRLKVGEEYSQEFCRVLEASAIRYGCLGDLYMS